MYQTSARSAHRKIMEAFAQTKGFDPSAFVRLTIDTSPATVLKMLEQFRLSLESAHDDLESVRGPEDELTVSKVCHKILGSSQLFGFGGLTQSIIKVREHMKISVSDRDAFMAGLDQLILTIGAMTSFLEEKCVKEAFAEWKDKETPAQAQTEESHQQEKPNGDPDRD